MKNVVYDLFTFQVRGIDRDPLPAEGSIDLPYPISLAKTVGEKTGNMIQKTNDNGEPLYKDNIAIDPTTDEETYTEVTTPRKVTKTETVTNTYQVATGETTQEIQPALQDDGTYKDELVDVPVYQTITTTSDNPVEWVDLEPVMVEEVVSRTYGLEQNPFILTKDDVEAARAKSIQDAQNAPPSDMDVVKDTLDFIILNL